jgi:hypothetical protein
MAGELMGGYAAYATVEEIITEATEGRPPAPGVESVTITVYGSTVPSLPSVVTV